MAWSVRLLSPSASVFPSRASAAETPVLENQAALTPMALAGAARPAETVARPVPNEPASPVALRPAGSSVVIETTPPMAADPQSDPWGPESTSIRPTSARSRLEKSKPPAGEVGSFTGAPSISTRVLSDEAPRILTVVRPPKAPARLICRPGTAASTSKAKLAWLSSIPWRSITTRSGVAAGPGGIRLAVTTSSSAANAGTAANIRAQAPVGTMRREIMAQRSAAISAPGRRPVSDGPREGVTPPAGGGPCGSLRRRLSAPWVWSRTPGRATRRQVS